MLQLKPFEKGRGHQFKLFCEVFHQESEFQIIYKLSGPLLELIVPQKSKEKEKRVKGLWESTCFEVFIKKSDSPSYLEFNFSPSGDWNSFSFSDYRQGMQEFLGVKKMQVDLKLSDNELTLFCHFNLDYPDLVGGKIKMGISSVLHLKDDQKIYYALVHPTAAADFHHQDSFVYAP